MCVLSTYRLDILYVYVISDEKGTSTCWHAKMMVMFFLLQAIDVWMSTCLVFVFSALIEYSLVNVLARRQSHKEQVQVGCEMQLQ